jgi:hypothetical protein
MLYFQELGSRGFQCGIHRVNLHRSTWSVTTAAGGMALGVRRLDPVASACPI